MNSPNRITHTSSPSSWKLVKSDGRFASFDCTSPMWNCRCEIGRLPKSVKSEPAYLLGCEWFSTRRPAHSDECAPARAEIFLICDLHHKQRHLYKLDCIGTYFTNWTHNITWIFVVIQLIVYIRSPVLFFLDKRNSRKLSRRYSPLHDMS